MINSSKEKDFKYAFNLSPAKYVTIKNKSEKYILVSKNSEGVYILMNDIVQYITLDEILFL